MLGRDRYFLAMLRHIGSKRTYRHNVKLASLLAMTAGFVNAAGFLAFATLTTNVTGYAALFAERMAPGDWAGMRVIALWMFLFLAGAFSSMCCCMMHSGSGSNGWLEKGLQS
jgi:uncharacterized membrane protein YoaK (UPF0700 family)